MAVCSITQTMSTIRAVWSSRMSCTIVSQDNVLGKPCSVSEPLRASTRSELMATSSSNKRLLTSFFAQSLTKTEFLSTNLKENKSLEISLSAEDSWLIKSTCSFRVLCCTQQPKERDALESTMQQFHWQTFQIFPLIGLTRVQFLFTGQGWPLLDPWWIKVLSSQFRHS